MSNLLDRSTVTQAQKQGNMYTSSTEEPERLSCAALRVTCLLWL